MPLSLPGRNVLSTHRRFLVAALAFAIPFMSPAQTRLVIDTDMATDCDDAGALAVAHALQNRGECVILAVVVNNKDPYSVGAVAAINSYYGRPDIPIGAYKGSVVGKTGSYKSIAENTALYGHQIVTRDQVPSAVETYRGVLAAQPDASVVIASIGWLNNLEDLLKSPADAISPLAGPQLVAQKVKSITIMGGRYPGGSEYNFTSFGSAPSTRYVVENWPGSVPVMFQGYELGENVTTGPSLRNTPPENPVRKAYETIYNGINGRHSWDQCAILHAVRGLSDYWTAVVTGSNHIGSDGTNAWQSSPDKNQAYSVAALPKAQLAAVIADLMDDPPQPRVSRFPVKVIFDTDYSTDCDDPGALAVLHALADNGEAEILATGLSTSRPKAPGAVDVVNTYYGRPDIPIGATKVGPSYHSAFTDHLFDHFPHDTPLSAAVEDAVVTYRRVLAAQPDASVVLVTVGYLTNVAELLKSGPDEHSPLTGAELVAAKVREWACMGGNFWNLELIDNVNFSRDVASADYAIKNFPGKITFLPREVASVPSPLRAGTELLQTPASNPVRVAYQLYFNGSTTNLDRHVADPATVLYAVRGHHDYWDLHAEGSMTSVHPDGRFTWDPAGARDHGHLVMKGGLGVYSNKAYVEGVIRGLLRQTPAAVAGVHAPVIAVHPAPVSVVAGRAASFSVVATANPPPAYQWLRDGSAIPGATGAVHTTPPLVAADHGATYRVVITNAEGVATSQAAAVEVSSGYALPPPWTGGDIGATGRPGSAEHSAGVFTVTGAGADIFGPADAFHFASRALSGDGEIRARVVSQGDTHPWAKAGVMIRATRDPGAPFALMAVTPGNGFRFQSRAGAGEAASSSVAGGALHAPPHNWVRLVRAGEVVAAHVSADGVAWRAVATVALPMAATVEFGLAVCSHDVGAASTAVFDNVSFSGGLLARYTFDESAPPFANHGAGGSALALADTGGASGRDNTGAGGYGAPGPAGLGASYDVPASGDGTHHTVASTRGGGALTATAVPQSALQGPDGAFTYEALVSISSTAGEQNILAHDGDPVRGFLFRVLNGALAFFDGAASVSAPIPVTGPHAFVADKWFHVAVVYTGAEGVAGGLRLHWTALDAGASSAHLIGSGALASDLAPSVANRLGVGTTTRSPFRYELRGRVDEVRLHGLALAADEFHVFAQPPVAPPTPISDTSGDGIPDSWALAHGLDPAADNALGDPDGDGIPNLLEFALGLEPGRASATGLPAVECIEDRLTLSATRNPDAAHLRFIPEVGSDLAGWASGPEHVTVIEDLPDHLVAVDNLPLSGSPRRFMRLRVEASRE